MLIKPWRELISQRLQSASRRKRKPRTTAGSAFVPVSSNPERLEERLLLTGCSDYYSCYDEYDDCYECYDEYSYEYPTVTVSGVLSGLEGTTLTVDVEISGGSGPFDIYIDTFGDGADPAESADYDIGSDDGYGYEYAAHDYFYFSPYDGPVTKTLSFTLTDDNIDENTEEAKISVFAHSLWTGNTEELDAGSISILDNDIEPTVQIGADPLTFNASFEHGNYGMVPEDHSLRHLPVELSHPSEKAITIDIASVDETALGGAIEQFGTDNHNVDYESINESFVRSAGPNQGTLIDYVTIRLNNDNWQEPEETFRLSLTATNAQTDAQPFGIVIDHNDIPQLIVETPDDTTDEYFWDYGAAYSHLDYVVTEGEVAGYNVSLSNPSVIPVSVLPLTQLPQLESRTQCFLGFGVKSFHYICCWIIFEGSLRFSFSRRIC